MPTEKDKIIKINLDLTETDVFKNETYQTNETFWTTDVNSAYLEFTTTEEVKGSVASLVLKNVDDGSLIQRNIEVTEAPFYYMLKNNEITHDGRWFGQVVVEMDGKAITARVFRFQITSSLLDSSDVALFDVENYRKLSDQLTVLYDQMNVYLANIKLTEEERERAEAFRKTLFEESQRAREVAFEQSEKIRSEVFSASENDRENLFNQNEEVRQSNEVARVLSEDDRKTAFEESQSDRTAAFNQSEINRSETFKINEDARQENETERISNESARIEAEGIRETTFAGNEAERSETFATNEADRKAGEVEREQNEETRQSNETSRIETFETYDGRIAGIEEDIVVEATNLIENGDLSEGLTTNFRTTNVNATANVVDGKLKLTDVVVNSNNALNITLKNKTVIGHKYYIKWLFNPYRNHNPAIYLNNKVVFLNKIAIKNIDNIMSTVYSAEIINSTVYLYNNGVNVQEMIVGSSVYYDDFIMFDLTETFGVGNEPTAAQMDRLLEQFPNSWFDGTVNIYNSKHMMGMFFKELTKLNNAIIALGGNV